MKINRRNLLAVLGSFVAPWFGTKVISGEEQKLPVAKFTEFGSVSNVEELFADAPYRMDLHQYRIIKKLQGYFFREAIIWVEEKDSFLYIKDYFGVKGITKVWGKMLLMEHGCASSVMRSVIKTEESNVQHYPYRKEILYAMPTEEQLTRLKEIEAKGVITL